MKNMLIFLLLLIFTSNCKTDNFTSRHSFGDYSATIQATGIKQALTVVHITDSHISKVDSSELTYFPFSSRMDKAYHHPLHYITNESGTKTGHFIEIIQKAKDTRAELILLTGDIVNNPSKSSVSFIANTLDASGIEYLYISGNHDWHYEGMEGTGDELREQWIKESLMPFYAGLNPLYYARKKSGINFVGIDNSTYQVTGEQLEFFKNEIQKKLPTVLLCHIPLYTGTPGDRVNTCGDPRWGYESDRNFEVERRLRWSKSGNLKSTTEFLSFVKSAPNLIAVITGHTHRARVDTLNSNLLQYRTQAAYSGAHRIIKFEPLDDLASGE